MTFVVNLMTAFANKNQILPVIIAAVVVKVVNTLLIPASVGKVFTTPLTSVYLCKHLLP